MPKQIARWQGTGNNALHSMSEWIMLVDSLRNIADSRYHFLLNDLVDHFNLPGYDSLALSVYPDHSGNIFVNQKCIHQLPWAGWYLNNVLVELLAVPKQGQAFSHWDLNGSFFSDQFAVTLSVDSFSNIEAIFIPDSTAIPNIVINEIFYAGGMSGDWIELANTGLFPVDLSNWSFSDRDSLLAFTIPQNTILRPDSYLILAAKQLVLMETVYHRHVVKGNLRFGLSALGESIFLYDHQKTLIDSVAYKNYYPWPEFFGTATGSIELISRHLDNNIGNNWTTGPEPLGSPGEQNSTGILYFDGIENQIISAGEVFDTIFFRDHFYHPDFSTDTVTWRVTNTEFLNVSVNQDLDFSVVKYQPGERGIEKLKFTASIPGVGFAKDSAYFGIGTTIHDSILCNTSWEQAESPFFIEKQITVPSGCILTIGPGVEIGLGRFGGLAVHGSLQVNGKDDSRTEFFNLENHWQILGFHPNATDTSRLNWTIVKGATFGIDATWQSAAVSAFHHNLIVRNCRFLKNQRCIYGHNGKVEVVNSYFKETNYGEKINLVACEALVENCTLEYTKGDFTAIDFDAGYCMNVSLTLE